MRTVKTVPSGIVRRSCGLGAGVGAGGGGAGAAGAAATGDGEQAWALRQQELEWGPARAQGWRRPPGLRSRSAASEETTPFRLEPIAWPLWVFWSALLAISSIFAFPKKGLLRSLLCVLLHSYGNDAERFPAARLRQRKFDLLAASPFLPTCCPARFRSRTAVAVGPLATPCHRREGAPRSVAHLHGWG